VEGDYHPKRRKVIITGEKKKLKLPEGRKREEI